MALPSRLEVQRVFEQSFSLMAWLEDHPDGLPTSFRVVLEDGKRETIQGMIEEFTAEPGVIRVSSMSERFDLVDDTLL